jgi:hypothetical protein
MPGVAGASITWGTGVTAQLPNGFASNAAVALSPVSCPSAGDCEAVGSYNDSSSNTQGVLLSAIGGAWTRGTKAPLPMNAAADPQVQINGVSCASGGNCAAVGDYNATSPAGVQGLLETETAGTWVTPGLEAGPPSPSTSPGVNLSSVSCPSAGNCIAVGDFTDSFGRHQGLIETLSGTTWTAQDAPVPIGSPTDPQMRLTSVSCPSDGDCAAVGTFIDSSSHQQGVLLDDKMGSWSANPAALPAHATNPEVHLLSVSCPSIGNCAAVGYYNDGSINQQGILFNETTGVWGAGVTAGLPGGAGTDPYVNLDSVSCPSAGNCAAVGYYADTSTYDQGLLLTESGGMWATPGVKAALPGPTTGTPNVRINSVSCISAGTCGAVGSYIDNMGNTQGLLLSDSAGAWGAGTIASLPNDASGPFVGLLSISCLPSGDCAAAGRYHNTSSFEGLLLNTGSAAPPAQPTLSVSAPVSGTVGVPVGTGSISAMLTGGASPTGTIHFTVFGPQPSPPTSCTSGGTSIGTSSPAGDGSYHPSGSFSPPAAGHYWWYASYGGDGGNSAAASACGAGMPGINVAASTSSGGPPRPTSPPQVTGPGTAGSTLSCSTGRWSPTPTSYAYSWNRDGTPIPGATGDTYVVNQLDEGSTLTCTVVASDQAGTGPPSTSQPLTITVPRVPGCPAASGSLHGTTLGLAQLGMTRAQARHVYSHYSTRGSYFRDYFCLTPRGIRVGYGSPELLATLPASHRHTFAGRVVWISTSNPLYAVAGIRFGATLAVAEHLLRGGNLIHIGLNFWYLAPTQGATAVLKTRHGIVEEIGIGDSRLARSLAEQRALMRSFY